MTMILIRISTLVFWSVVTSFYQTINLNRLKIIPLYNHASLSIGIGESNDFDSDFADSMSKPLPKWFQEQKEEQDKHIKEIERNRERIMQEFKQKYEIVDEQQKTKEYEAKMANRLNQKPSWLSSIFQKPTQVELDENNEKTTKQKWKEFLMEEQQNTGLVFPNLLDLFPELKMFKWPIWAKTRSGNIIQCETDSDCQFPQACCPHPILPGDKFCCTGFGRRAMVPAYQTRTISPQIPPSSSL